jgi:hypothetical protein
VTLWPDWYVPKQTAVNSREWRRLYEQEWRPSPRDLLREIGQRYHEECEAYDRTVCTGPITRDGIMPRTHEELGRVNPNARAVMTRLHRQYPQLSWLELMRAISDYRG